MNPSVQPAPNLRFATRSVLLLWLLISVPIFAGCGGEESGDERFTVEGEGLSVESPWVRPAGEGRMSAGYFLLTNYAETVDTLRGVSSDVARLTEIHESYELEEGMMGMREVEQVPLAADGTVSFEPGGLHIMFIQLTQTLEEGDTVDLTLHFAGGEDLTVSMPVQP